MEMDSNYPDDGCTVARKTVQFGTRGLRVQKKYMFLKMMIHLPDNIYHYIERSSE